MNPKKILLVEDEEVIRRLMKRVLLKSGHELTFGEGVQLANQLIQKNSFDLLITDLKLPDGTGVDVIEKFMKKFPDKNIIIVTGSPTPEDRLQHIKNFDELECIFKPFEPATLNEAVKKALEKNK